MTYLCWLLMEGKEVAVTVVAGVRGVRVAGWEGVEAEWARVSKVVTVAAVMGMAARLKEVTHAWHMM